MEREWNTVSIGELNDAGVLDIQTGPFGSQLHAHDYVPLEGVPVIPTEAIRDRRIDLTVLPRISTAKAASLARHSLAAGDILFARRGVQATGHIGYIRALEVGYICGTGAIRLRVLDRRTVDPEFLSHVLANPTSVAYFKFHAIGATMPNLNEGIIRSFSFGLPPLNEQRRVAASLSDLDDKIQLNRNMAETLEAMARALFKSWFVDFDPVRAKAGGRDAGVPAHIAALFPDSLVDSELGEIPKSWSVGKVADLSSLSKASISPNKYPDEEFAHFSIPAYDEGKKPRIEVGSSIKSNKFTVDLGAVLLSKLNPSIPRVWLPDLDILERPICSTEFLVLIPQNDSLREYIFSLLTSEHFRTQFLSLVGGTSNSHQRVKPDGLLAMRVILPKMDLIAEYTAKVRPLLRRIQSNSKESYTLATVRDTLLPKLISGELRLGVANQLAEVAI